MKGTTRRLGAVLAAAVAVLALAASPAFAHFCSKSGWSDSAFAQAANSQAWMTAADWMQIIDEIGASGEEDLCAAAFDNLRAQVASQDENTLFMGPGLLAGGTLHNGKGNTPAHFDHLDFDEAVSACA